MTPMQKGRLNKALDKQYRFDGVIKTLRQHLEDIAPLTKSESDGMIEYSRIRFNRMSSNREQDEYIARLKAKRLYFLNGWQVPKVVYDSI